jgi:hypothetical protein
LFTFCPPEPDARTKLSAISSSAMEMVAVIGIIAIAPRRGQSQALASIAS